MYNRDKIIQTLRNIVKESEEIEPYVVVAQPRRNKKETAAQSFNAYGLCHVDFMGYSMGFVDIDGEKVDVARNYLIDRVLDSKAKYLLFIGEDTVLPFDGFKRLHATAEKNPNSMIVGVYYVKCGGPMIDVRDGFHIKEANIDPGQIFEIWQGGLDCALIPTSILRDLKERDPDLPYCCIANQIEDIPFVGEDNFFYHRLRASDYNVLVDTDVQCLHVDLENGKYSAHPSVNLANYYTNIKITTPLTLADKAYINKRWESRLPLGTGNMSFVAGYSIPEIIKDVENPIGIEIGTSEGFSTDYLLRTIPSLRLFGIDPYVQYVDWDKVNKKQEDEKEMFFYKVGPYMNEGRYTHLLMTSDEGVNKFKDSSLDFVFLDGLHTYEQVLKDCENYYEKVKSGGVLCGHDYNMIPDVKKAVDEFSLKHNKTILFGKNDLWYWIK
jgi:hypothetical protein